WFLSPAVIGTAAFVILIGLGATTLIGAYLLGFIGRPGGSNTNGNTATPTPTVSNSPVETSKPDLVSIPGGTFKMGNNKGRPNERRKHDVQVPPFKMDKTEVTNAEFLEFLAAMNYKQPGSDKFLSHWVNGKPIAGQERAPVRFVSID